MHYGVCCSLNLLKIYVHTLKYVWHHIRCFLVTSLQAWLVWFLD